MRRSSIYSSPGLLGWVGCALALAALWAGWWWVVRWGIDWPVDHGLRLLAAADSPLKVSQALERWERDVRPRWDARADELAQHILRRRGVDDPHVRRLLSHWTNSDFGARAADWQHWLDTRRRLRRGLPPEPPRGQSVRLEKMWEAPVGLTGWFTTILPLDGQIYVASLGETFGERVDPADGIVRVDGRSGVAELIFTPPDRPPRDIIGIAAVEEGLVAACHNGFVYCVTLNGALRWKEHVGAPIVAPPMTIDINRDGVHDVIVITKAGKVVALNGARGRTAWVATIGSGQPGGSAFGASLAYGDFLPGGGEEILACTAEGELQLLTPATGVSRWKRVFEAGSLSGATGQAAAGPSGFLLDRAARTWALVPSGGRVEAVLYHSLALRPSDTLIAAPRLLNNLRERPPRLLACPTGGYADAQTALAVLEAQGVVWRAALPGAIWGTPAVANLNEPREPEIVVATIEPAQLDAAGSAGSAAMVGGLLIFNQSGQLLRRERLPAPVECSPVIADVDGDNRLEILVVDQGGLMHCFKTGGIGPVEWGLYGGDSHNTRNAAHAYSFGQAPFGFQGRWRP